MPAYGEQRDVKRRRQAGDIVQLSAFRRQRTFTDQVIANAPLYRPDHGRCGFLEPPEQRIVVGDLLVGSHTFDEFAHERLDAVCLRRWKQAGTRHDDHHGVQVETEGRQPEL